MAVAASVAAAAATAVATGVSVAGQAGAFGSNKPSQPQIKQVPKRPFETAQQKYMSRVMMANLNTRGPTYSDWLKSGGQATFQLTDPGMRPLEAEQLGFTDRSGATPDFYDPSKGGPLTRPQWIQAGQEMGPDVKTPQAQIGRMTGRINRLQNLATTQEGGLRPGQQARLDRLTNRQNQMVNQRYQGAR